MSSGEVGNDTLRYRLTEVERKVSQLDDRVEKRMKELEDKLDRLTIAIVGGSITVAVSVVVFTVTYLASGPT